MLWLLSMLVVIIAVFCSTFLSWPIAVVCTLVILLGHWGVEQLGDASLPGVGHNIATEMNSGFGSQQASTRRLRSFRTCCKLFRDFCRM